MISFCQDRQPQETVGEISHHSKVGNSLVSWTSTQLTPPHSGLWYLWCRKLQSSSSPPCLLLFYKNCFYVFYGGTKLGRHKFNLFLSHLCKENVFCVFERILHVSNRTNSTTKTQLQESSPTSTTAALPPAPPSPSSAQLPRYTLFAPPYLYP